MVFATDTDIDIELYPSSDGKPMAENTIHYQWITTIKENLESLFAAEPMVFVAADLFWHPVRLSPTESKKGTYLAPDVMVVFGRPKGQRDSYIQHREGDVPPQAIFEIHSPSNDTDEWNRKFAFYQQHGVEEYYYVYPEDNLLEVWLRQGSILKRAAYRNEWVSPRLQIRFDLSGETMGLYHPNGEPFKSFTEIRAEKEHAERERDRERMEKERERAEKERLAAKLRELGIDPDEV